MPPHNLEAEASVLGSLMLDRNAIVRVADFLRPADFYLDHHAQVYRAALNLYDRAEPIDLLTLAAELEKMLVLERIGGQAFLAELQSGVPTAANVEYYGHLVEEGATKRKLISAGGRITALGFDESTPASQALDTAEGVIFNIAEGRITQDFVALKDILKTTWDQIEQIHKDQSVISGVPSGFNDLDSEGVPGLGWGSNNHAVCVALGMKKSARWGWLAKMWNSWGTVWGWKGFCWLPIKKLVTYNSFECYDVIASNDDPSDATRPPVLA